jgi:hypothetical protein
MIPTGPGPPLDVIEGDTPGGDGLGPVVFQDAGAVPKHARAVVTT